MTTTAPKDSRINNMHTLVIEAVKAQRAIDKKTDNVSNSLLLCAKVYQAKKDIGTKAEHQADQFIIACKEEEDFIKSSQAKQNQVDKLPRCWTQAKSNIKAAINLGIDLSKYESESMLRKEVTKLRGQKEQSSFDKKMKQFKDDMTKLPTQQAEELLDQLMAAAAEAVQAIVDGDVVEVVTEAEEQELAQLLKATA